MTSGSSFDTAKTACRDAMHVQIMPLGIWSDDMIMDWCDQNGLHNLGNDLMQIAAGTEKKQRLVERLSRRTELKLNVK